MEVRFTHPMHSHLTLRGTIIEMVTNHSHFEDHFVILDNNNQAWDVKPNDDPHFQFVPSTEGARRRAKQIDQMIEEINAEKVAK